MPKVASTITGLVLAGGRGMRMGGLDKGLQTLRGEALALHVLRRLAPQVGPLLISANRHQDDYTALGAPFGARVLADADPPDTFAGPLAGLLAGLRSAATPELLCVPCDAPLLPTDLAARLSAARAAAGAPLAYAVSPDGPQPVFALLSTSLLEDLAATLARGERKVRTWYAHHKAVEVNFAEGRAFYNVNSLQALAELEHD
jgi:molybdenum cofactor guanylyltransferase